MLVDSLVFVNFFYPKVCNQSQHTAFYQFPEISVCINFGPWYLELGGSFLSFSFLFQSICVTVVLQYSKLKRSPQEGSLKNSSPQSLAPEIIDFWRKIQYRTGLLFALVQNDLQTFSIPAMLQISRKEVLIILMNCFFLSSS